MGTTEEHMEEARSAFVNGRTPVNMLFRPSSPRIAPAPPVRPEPEGGTNPSIDAVARAQRSGKRLMAQSTKRSELQVKFALFGFCGNVDRATAYLMAYGGVSELAVVTERSARVATWL